MVSQGIFYSDKTLLCILRFVYTRVCEQIDPLSLYWNALKVDVKIVFFFTTFSLYLSAKPDFTGKIVESNVTESMRIVSPGSYFPFVLHILVSLTCYVWSSLIRFLFCYFSFLLPPFHPLSHSLCPFLYLLLSRI